MEKELKRSILINYGAALVISALAMAFGGHFWMTGIVAPGVLLFVHGRCPDFSRRRRLLLIAFTLLSLIGIALAIGGSQSWGKHGHTS